MPKHLSPKIWTPILIAVAIVAGYLVWQNQQRPLNSNDIAKPGSKVHNVDQPCIQVITPARNLQTGEVRDFPTPCDVPEGWEKI